MVEGVEEGLGVAVPWDMGATGRYSVKRIWIFAQEPDIMDMVYKFALRSAPPLGSTMGIKMHSSIRGCIFRSPETAIFC